MESEKHVPDVDDYDDDDDDDDYSRVCSENSRCPWKNCAVHCLCCAGLPAQAALADSRFWLFSKTELSQTAQPALWPPAES